MPVLAKRRAKTDEDRFTTGGAPKLGAWRAWLVAALVLVASSLTTAPVGAQTPPDSGKRADTLSLDSLRARLERAEAAIALLREQLGTESESAVHSRSRLHLDFSIQMLMNVFDTFGRVNNVDVPQVVLTPATGTPAAPSNKALGFTLRQTRVGASGSVTDALGGTFAGDVDFDLFGGAQNGPGDRRLFPEPRLRTARARLIWPYTEVMVGADAPLISMLNPLSLASIGTPDFAAAGNLWYWLGQVRVTQDIATFGQGIRAPRVALQAAVISPYAAQLAPSEQDAVDAGERSGRPAFEERLRLRWGAANDEGGSDLLIGTTGGEIGVGGHQGWIATSASTLVATYALAADARVVLAPGMELRGEWYAGRLLRGLGGGAIAQNFGSPSPTAPPGALGPPISTVAGWAQLNVQPRAWLIAGVGCGVDLPNPDDAPTRFQNTVCAVHGEWRPVQPVVVGFEFRQFGTRYQPATFGARTFNLAFGFEL